MASDIARAGSGDEGLVDPRQAVHLVVAHRSLVPVGVGLTGHVAVPVMLNGYRVIIRWTCRDGVGGMSSEEHAGVRCVRPQFVGAWS